MRQLRALSVLALLLAAASGTEAQVQTLPPPPPGPVEIMTFVELRPDATPQGLELMRRYRDAVQGETGSASAVLLREVGRDNRFVLVESWQDRAAAEAHDKAGGATALRDGLKPLQYSLPDRRVTHDFAIAAPAGEAGAEALFILTHVDVTPPGREATEGLLKALAEDSRKDAGNLRYDVYQQDPPRLNHFMVLAGWESRKAFDAQADSGHRLAFREKLGPLLGALYDERLFTLVK